MKSSLTCPKCAHRKIWRIDHADVPQQIQMPDDAMPEAFRAKALAAGKHMFKQDEVRGFETLVCAQCGYTEWYATTFEHVAKVGTLLDAETGAYR